MTHDLIKNVLAGLDARVHKVVVTELKEDTFYAVIWMERDGKIISVDSRPSDALALALRVDCPIFVEEEVLKTSKKATATIRDHQRRTSQMAGRPKRRRPGPLQNVRGWRGNEMARFSSLS